MTDELAGVLGLSQLAFFNESVSFQLFVAWRVGWLVRPNEIKNTKKSSRKSFKESFPKGRRVLIEQAASERSRGWVTGPRVEFHPPGESWGVLGWRRGALKLRSYSSPLKIYYRANSLLGQRIRLQNINESKAPL